MPEDPSSLDYCYVTTRGRRTGRPHEIEIWFGKEGSSIYLLSGGREGSDWVKNIRNDPRVEVRLGDKSYSALARIVDDPSEDVMARKLLLGKYGPRYTGDLSDWGKTALPVAIDLGIGG